MAVATFTGARPKPQINCFPVGPFLLAWGALDLSAAADTYATGGQAVTWPVPLKTPVFVHIYGSVTKTIGYAWDYAASKLKVFTTLALTTEKTNGQAMNTTVDVATDLPYFIGIFTK